MRLSRATGISYALTLGYEQLVDVGSILSWRDLAYGWELGLVDVGAVVRLAEDRVEGVDGEGPGLELALLLSHQYDAVPGLLRRAAELDAGGSGPDASSDDKWMFLLLRALHRVRHRLTEPLAAVEDVYELFDHPREMAGLVGYMPVPDGEDPDETIEERWGRWVREAGRRFSGGGR